MEQSKLTASFLSKSSCITAFSAQFFCSLPALKTMIYGFCSRLFQYNFQIFIKQITKCQITVMIQTAGDNSTVTKNADLVPQTITEYTVAAFRSSQVGPVKFIAVFQKNAVSDAYAFSFLCPPDGCSRRGADRDRVPGEPA